MFDWIIKFRNNYKNRYRVGYKRGVYLLWLEVSFGLVMVVFMMILVKIFLD